jgi:hypothetical protein
MNDSQTIEKEQQKEKRAVGIFPRISLSKAMELANAIYELGEGEPIRRRTIFDKLGKSPDSGPSRVLITASNSGYGLTTGGYQAELLGLTERGKQAAASQFPVKKIEAIYEALYSNEIFTSFVNRFNDRGVPIDEVAIEFLKSNHNLSQDDAEACWSVFKENLMEQNLTQELSGKRIIISRETAIAELTKTSGKNPATNQNDALSDSGMLVDKSQQNIGNAVKGKSDPITTQIHFNIQVVIPENATPETYDNIFRSIATHLLHREN